MEKWQKRAIDLLTSVAFGTDGDASVVPYYPQKTEIDAGEIRYFRRTSPEAHGISSKRIYNMLCELESERRANIHSIIVLKDGEVISEASRAGYSVNLRHLAHSMSKSVTGMAIGMLVDDGKLDTGRPICEIFPEIPYKDKRFSRITVEHLLTMTSGVSFSEAGSVTESEWTRAYFSAPLRFEPGSEFSYNSMNSYVLARVVQRISGLGLVDFLRERLFAPLGIENYQWETGPEGVEKGGWGLYLSAESWAKLGQLYLDGGQFGGKRVISSEWIRRSSETRGIAPKKNGDFNYGYHLWVARESSEILFNGMLGQNVWICPKNGIVAVLCCGNNELFQDSPALEIVRKYLAAPIADPVVRRDARVLREREKSFFESRRWAHPCEENRGILPFLGLRPRRPFVKEWGQILGDYAVATNRVGILPLFVRGMQNNLGGGISRLSLRRVGESLWLSITEAGEEYSFEIGLYRYADAVLDFRGERYILRAMGDAVCGPSGEIEYRIELIFPELPNTRMLRIIAEDGVLRVEASEQPGDQAVEVLIDKIPELGLVPRLAFAGIEKMCGVGSVGDVVARAFSPVLSCVDLSLDDATERLAELNAQAAERSRGVTLLVGFVERFISVGDGREATPDASKGRGFLGGLLDRFLGRTEPAVPTVAILPSADVPSDGEPTDGEISVTE